MVKAPPKCKAKTKPPHKCERCGLVQARLRPCAACHKRGRLRWCLGCFKRQMDGHWSCRPCRDLVRGLGEAHRGLAKEGFLSGDRVGGDVGWWGVQLQTWVLEKQKHKQKGWHKGAALFASGTGSDPGRAMLRPPPQARDPKWDYESLFHLVCPLDWRDALISVTGGCDVLQVVVPAVMPGTPAQPLHIDHTLPPGT